MKNHIMCIAASLAVCGGMLLSTAPARQAMAQETSTAAYLNTALPAKVRARDLVGRMTLEEKASQLVNQARAIPRLKVPAYDWWSEALHGVMVDGTTEFPEPIGLGATFDAPGIHAMAIDIGTEARVVHRNALKDGGSTIFHGKGYGCKVHGVSARMVTLRREWA